MITIIFIFTLDVNIISIMYDIFIYLIFSNQHTVEKGVVPTLVQEHLLRQFEWDT